MMLAQSNGDTPAKAFIRSFMKPIASVDGEPVPAFNPSGNARHAAIQYVYENGGKGRSVSVAEEALQKTIASRKTPKEAKAEARAMLGELSQLDGSVAIYEPQLGPYFRYKQGEELWQSPAHRESSIAAVRKQYEGTDKWMMAPNGKATNLSEQQWLIVRTPEFKRWFGDWEADPANASKVVDANGEPLVVFHGSPEKNIEVFANHSQMEGHESGHRSTGDAGIYTSPRRSYAERYTAADLASDESSGGRVYELYLNIRRPATLAEAGLSHPDKITAEKAAELREQGYDGIMYEHRKRPEYIVLDPRQIKSTENRGSFDPENPNSLYQGKAREGASQRVVQEDMFPPTQNEKPLHAEAATLDEVYTKAAANKDAFQNGVRSIAEATGGKALLRPGDGLKTRERAQEKISRDYGNAPGAHNRVVDILGGTVLYHSTDDVRTALPEILRGIEAMGGTVIRIKDRFLNPNSGYKDLLINIRMKDGLVTELLVTTEKLAEAKNGIGHKLYEITQAIDEYYPIATKEEQAVLDDIAYETKNASELYYGSTGNQSNATASASVIREPLYMVSARLPELSRSSIYPRLSSSLEKIWKNPSFEKTKGMSSYSQNSGLVRESMETGGSSGKNRSAMEGTSFEGEAALPRKEIIPENEAQGKSVSDFSDVSAEDRAFMEQRAVEGDGFDDVRGHVMFNATEDGRAVIEFFKSADASTAPHELYHIFRREMEKTANTEGVSERAREMWRQVCDFVGAKEGEKWTVEMEEKFARAGERFLMEGKAPIPALQSVFEKMKQWFTDIYQNADEAGLEISDGMRKIFGEMLSPSPEEADAMFRYHMGKLLQSDPSEGMDTRLELPEDTGDARKVLSDAQADA